MWHVIRLSFAPVLLINISAARSAFLDRTTTSISSGCTKGGYVWWRRVKDFGNISSSKPLIPDLQDGDRHTNTQLEKVDLLAQHFATQCTFPQEANQFPCSPSSIDKDASATQFHLPTFSPGQVHCDLTHLSSRKSTSSNQIVPILRSMADLLCKPLSCLFNSSLSTSQFPTAWKSATVIPLKGKGSASLPTNYRPISLLHSISRLFESRIAHHLNSYLHRHCIISPSQFAYVPQRSATDQLILLTNHIARLSDRGQKFDCAFLDFQKAFDKVHHPTLLSHMNTFMAPEAHAWFRSYLLDRSLSVKLDATHSFQYIMLNCGIPQGSHLAPPLFLLYINSLPDIVNHSSPFLFADDVTLLNAHDVSLSLDENLSHLQQDLASCQHWAQKIHGKFSPEKTFILSNSNIPESSSVSMDNVLIGSGRSAKHLGVELSDG